MNLSYIREGIKESMVMYIHVLPLKNDVDLCVFPVSTIFSSRECYLI